MVGLLCQSRTRTAGARGVSRARPSWLRLPVASSPKPRCCESCPVTSWLLPLLQLGELAEGVPSAVVLALGLSGWVCFSDRLAVLGNKWRAVQMLCRTPCVLILQERGMRVGSRWCLHRIWKAGKGMASSAGLGAWQMWPQMPTLPHRTWVAWAGDSSSRHLFLFWQIQLK